MRPTPYSAAVSSPSIDPEFWRGKRVLVAGCTGFQGSWLCLWLQYLGAQVVGYGSGNLATMFTAARVAEGMTLLENPGASSTEVQRAIATHSPDLVLHWAAGEAGWVQQWPAATEQIVLPLGQSQPVALGTGAIATVQTCGVVGGGDEADTLVPRLVRSLQHNTPPSLDNPHAIHTLHHVLEPLHGYLLLAERLYHDGAAFAGHWTFGPRPSQTETAGAIARRLYSLWGHPYPAPTPTLPGHPPHYAPVSLPLEDSQTRDRLGWRTVLDLPTTLQWVVEWSRAQQAHADLRAHSFAQIQHYMALTQTQRHGRTLADVAQDPAAMARLRFCC